jgi:dolichol-phosphate mannosyltransferase
MINTDKKTVSIVIPFYNEENNLPKLYEELIAVLGDDINWEILLVDDGSSDNSWEKLKSLHEIDPRIRGIRFSRNFGHQNALYAGFGFSRGDAVITMDSDLQHPPFVIPDLIREWEKGYKIVHTVRKDPESIPFTKKVTSWAFYKLFTWLSGVEISAGMADFRLLDRQVVDELMKSQETGVFLRGLVQWVGFPSTKVIFQCRDRYSGQSKYTFYKMVKFAWRGITSFSIIPLRIGIMLGLITSLFAFYVLADALFTKLFTDKAVPGWTSIIGVVSLLFGVLFILIGLLGEYIGKVLIQVRGRPLYIVREKIDA